MTPIRPNDALDAQHCLYAGTTGAGKSTAVRQMGRVKETDQVLMWDPYGQYKGQRFLNREVRTYSSLTAFFNAAKAGRQTNRGFKIAFTPKTLPSGTAQRRRVFLAFLRACWAMGDGHHKKLLHLYLEEINRVTVTSGDEDSIYGELLEGGRKFGFVTHSVSQRLQPIPNTVISMSPYKWVGIQEAIGDVSRVAREIGVTEKQITDLEPLEYYFKNGRGFNNVTKGKLKFPKKKAA
ncbi:hypothetical protein PCIT_a3042 [Pseudoalteromonas citrea]|uniref:Helicase HerA central domain-containing protein n=3 Tax=Pseudoalteromonas TaxID=53246 RepID=A0A5S3V1K7_9GAMM|nr:MULTISPECIES: hypothetical protein [Pseudoalteromonas]KAF7770087.1 hypothetical protein PCIT_a3042 [Pseudoalteromonas citrea]TMO64434.1 hypothetical protein CWC19_18355 [Pseudoalteromonas aurantia]